MDILILGGTGAMGNMLIKLLANDNAENHVTVTSRRDHVSEYASVRYVKGNAKDINFLKEILCDRYEIIIDFMVYTTAEFEHRYELLLSNTGQYVFISSARVYAQSDIPITEESPRLLDVCTDTEYLATDEYALAKARCENLLNTSGKKNYTIVRPSITYGNQRLQLGVLEKEGWLYRALHGRSIVFSNCNAIQNRHAIKIKSMPIFIFYKIFDKIYHICLLFLIICVIINMPTVGCLFVRRIVCQISPNM